MLNGLNSATNHQEELLENVNDRGHSIWNSERLDHLPLYAGTHTATHRRPAHSPFLGPVRATRQSSRPTWSLPWNHHDDRCQPSQHTSGSIAQSMTGDGFTGFTPSLGSHKCCNMMQSRKGMGAARTFLPNHVHGTSTQFIVGNAYLAKC